MTHYHSLSEVIKAWFHSADFNKYDTLYGFRFLWLSRTGQLLQFFASLTIVAEILGQEKITKYRNQTDALVDLKAAGIRFKGALLDVNKRSQPSLVHLFLRLLPTSISELYKKYWITSAMIEVLTENEVKKTKFGTVVFIIVFPLLVLAVFYNEFLLSSPTSTGGLLLLVHLMIGFVVCYEISAILGSAMIFSFEILRAIILTLVEFLILYPIVYYLVLSEREKALKLTAFVLFFFGFLTSLLFS